MASTRTPGALGRQADRFLPPARDRVPLGVNDRPFARMPFAHGDTPGPTGLNDGGRPKPFDPALIPPTVRPAHLLAPPPDARRRPGPGERLYRVEGDWDERDAFPVAHVPRRIPAAENVLVVATGRRGGAEHPGRAPYHLVEVRPASEPAERLFGGKAPRFVPEHLLTPVRLSGRGGLTITR